MMRVYTLLSASPSPSLTAGMWTSCQELKSHFGPKNGSSMMRITESANLGLLLPGYYIKKQAHQSVVKVDSLSQPAS